MAFARPTLAELITRTTADLVSRLALQAEVLRRAVVRVLAKVWSAAVYGLHGHLDWAARQLFASTADASELDKHGLDYGVTRTPATFAAGDYTFTGTNGTVVPAGTTIQRSDGLRYDTQADGTVSGGVVTVEVRAKVSGSASNTEEGVNLTLVSPIAGIQSSGAVAAGGITNGADAEGDESYRARILERKRRTPHGGAIRDYERWAKEVSGVTRVWVRPNWMGPGTVGIAFVLDGAEDIIPDEDKVQEVQDYIDDPSRRPVTAEVIVFAPEAVEQDFEISLSPDSAAAKAAVEAELEDYLRRVGEPGVTLPLSNIDEAISSAPGEDSHTLVSPSADPTFEAHQIPVMGTVTWV